MQPDPNLEIKLDAYEASSFSFAKDAPPAWRLYAAVAASTIAMATSAEASIIYSGVQNVTASIPSWTGATHQSAQQGSVGPALFSVGATPAYNRRRLPQRHRGVQLSPTGPGRYIQRTWQEEPGVWREDFLRRSAFRRILRATSSSILDKRTRPVRGGRTRICRIQNKPERRPILRLGESPIPEQRRRLPDLGHRDQLGLRDGRRRTDRRRPNR